MSDIRVLVEVVDQPEARVDDLRAPLGVIDESTDPRRDWSSAPAGS